MPMKKIYLLNTLFIFTLVLSACSNQGIEPIDSLGEEQNQPQSENSVSKEEIRSLATENSIEGIEANEEISSPITITGKTPASKDQLFVELRDSEKNSKIRAYALVTENEGKENTYQITLNFIFSSTSEGYIAVYELDSNGQEKNLTELPVKFKTQN